jgi:hypothetical protein
MRAYSSPSWRLLAGLLAGIAVGVGAAAPAAAVPTERPYPDITQFKRVIDLEKFKVIDKEGIWFSTPVGQHCGIADDGSYGCSGDLPGAPPGENEVAWFPGDPSPRLYHTDEPRFDSGTGQSIINMRTYVEFRGSRCGVTENSAIYCMHGDDPNSQIMVTTGMTLRGPDAAPSS